MNKTAFITGASTGIGYEFAKRYAELGYNLIIVSRNRETLEKVPQRLEQEYGISCMPYSCDLADTMQVEKLINKLKSSNLQINVVINNAGIGQMGGFHLMSNSEIERMLMVNIFSLVKITKELLPPMIERGEGVIINVASTAGFQPGPGSAVYFASKSFVLFFTEAIAEELSKFKNIQVQCLCPGPTDTPFALKSGMGNTASFRAGMGSPADVVKKAIASVKSDKVIVIPGINNLIVYFLVKFSPRFLVRKISRKLLETS